MAIISFWSISRKVTGQSLSMAAVMTSMAVDHNMKILGISTEFNDTTLESGFFDVEKEKKRMIELQKSRQLINNIPGMEGMGMPITGGKLDSGIEGVIKIINSKRITDQIVKDYTKVVFKDRLDILPSPSAANYDVYKETVSKAKDVVELADKEYNMVFVDVDKDLPKEYARDILSISDIVMINLTQGTKQLEEFLKLKKTDDLFKKNNILMLLGKFDRFSKYNTKNITRYLKLKKEICAIPYNTLFFEAAMDAQVADYFLRYRDMKDETDRNKIFINEAKRTCDEIVTKLDELRLSKMSEQIQKG